MVNNMVVLIKDLELAVTLLLAKYRENIGEKVILSKDYYWEIDANEIYDPYERPQNVTLGQLSFDLEEIQNSIAVDGGIAFDLRKVASILTALSIENPTAF